MINNERGIWKEDEKLIEYLKERQAEILNSNLNEIEKMYWLTEDCKRYEPHLSRPCSRRFYRVTMLKSLVKVGLLEEDDYHTFLNSLEVVNSQTAVDLQCDTKKDFSKSMAI